MTGGINLPDQIQHVWAYGPGTPTAAAPDHISLKNVKAVEIVIQGVNASGVTGSAVTVNQAQAVAGTNAKALAFTTYFSMTDPANSANYTKATAASNTFTTTNTNSAQFVYRIAVDPATLDSTNGFDCLAVALANAVNSTITAHYNVVNKYGGNAVTMASVIAD
jgi:hypothetical protein